MIKLERNFTPIQLTPDLIKEYTLEFKTSGKSVWNVNWLKNSLLKLSHGKCAYCECSLEQESKYMEVEHFEDKSHFPDKVMVWENLLPSCKRCNGSKSNHNVIDDPICNPFLESPSNHIYFKLYRFHGKDEKGKSTIDVVDLNNTERAVKKRFDIGEGLQNLIEVAFDQLFKFKESPITKRKNKLRSLVEGILLECQPFSSYSATCATVLLNDDRFLEIKAQMNTLGIWDENLEALLLKSTEIIL